MRRDGSSDLALLHLCGSHSIARNGTADGDIDASCGITGVCRDGLRDGGTSMFRHRGDRRRPHYANGGVDGRYLALRVHLDRDPWKTAAADAR